VRKVCALMNPKKEKKKRNKVSGSTGFSAGVQINQKFVKKLSKGQKIGARLKEKGREKWGKRCK